MVDHVIHMEGGRLASDTPFHVVQQIVSDAVHEENIVIHFHGGLVNETNARAMANRLLPIYQQAGAYPIFPVWEAGLFETIQNNLGDVAREKLFQLVLKRVRNIARRKFVQDEGGRSAGVVPVVDVSAEEEALILALETDDASLMPDEPIPSTDLSPLSDTEILTLEMEFQQDPELQIVAQEVSAGLRNPEDIMRDEATRSMSPIVASSFTFMDSAAVKRLVDQPDPSSRGVFSIIKMVKAIVIVAGRVIARYLAGRDHGFHATVVEEILREFYIANIGGTIWSHMKGDTRDSFDDDPTQYGGTALLSELGKRIQAGARPKVTLVGHSTGAVYIAHLLEASASLIPADFKFNVVLLAPASTFDLTVSTFIPHQEKIGGLRMFTMTDENEKADQLVPVLYPHSLLYFISGVLEPDADCPIVGMQLFYDPLKYEASKFKKVAKFRQFIANINNGVVWSVNNGEEGLNTEALHHGDFDNDPATLDSIQQIIQNGF